MNEADASPGGGAAQPTSAPTSPAANQGTAQPSFTIDDVKAAARDAITSTFGELRNGLFADLRKAGALKPDKPSPTAPAQAPVPMEAPPASSGPGMTVTDFHAELARQRSFDRVANAAGLNDRQLSRMEEAYRAVKPSDPGEWARGYLEDLGLGKTNPTKQSEPTISQPQTPVTPAAVAATPQPTTNISDKGRAVSSDARDPLAVLQHRPTEATGDDFERLVVEHGRAKALEMWVANSRNYLRSVKIVPDKRQR